MKKDFSIEHVLRLGWNSFKERYWFFIGLTFIYAVISSLPSVFDFLEKRSPQINEDPIFIMLDIFTNIAVFILGLIIPIGFTYILLRTVDNTPVSTRDLFSTHGVFWKYILSGLLSAIIMVIGFVLLIVPGIIASIALMFVSYIVVEERLSPVDAIRKSYHMTKGMWLKLFGFGFVLLLLNIVGMIPLGIGLLITVPISFLAVAHLYKMLKNQELPVIVTSEIPVTQQEA